MDNYLLTNHRNDILRIIEDPDENKHFSVNINFIVLFEQQPQLANEFLKEPETTIDEWDNELRKNQTNLLLELENTNDENTNISLKNNTHCRVYALPACPELHRKTFPGNEDADKFLQISGIVVRITSTRMLEYQRHYICAKCKHTLIVKAEYDKKNIITAPKKCENRESCKSTNIITFGDLHSDNCKDYQEVKVQEHTTKLGVGSIPNSIWITLEDDLVEICKPGDNITVCGTLKRRWGVFSPNKKIDIELVLKANHVQITNSTSYITMVTPEIKQMFKTFWENYSDRPLVGRNQILKSFCPQLYGLYAVKLAIAIVLAGGVQVQQDPSTTVRVRSEPHILLVGDPGTGKSEIIRYASKIIPRSVLTTGVGSTAAGLTVTAIMENGEWQLEGGALVLADGGICCIDEFNSMKEHDRTSIHEAMEQQSISVAKASIVCKLSTRCSILAATNPKGNIDRSQPLNMNIALPSPLLSRFDLVLLLKDTVNNEWDSLITDYILSGKHSYSKLTDNVTWSLDVLQAYFGVIKKINPILTPEAHAILTKYYRLQRQNNCSNKARTTVRLLDSLVRLSQGHARLMFHNEVLVMDAIMAIALIETAFDRESSLLDIHVDVQGVFPGNPMENYKEIIQNILPKLQLQNLLEEEFKRFNFSEMECENVIESRFFQDTNKINQIFHINDTHLEEGNSKITENLSQNNSLGTKEKPEASTSNREKINSPQVEKNKTIENELFNSSNIFISDRTLEENIQITENLCQKKVDNSLVSTDNKKAKEKPFKKPEASTSDDEKLNSPPVKKKKAFKKEINDFKLLNFVPSVNDDFDLNMLEFDEHLENNGENNSTVCSKKESVTCKSNNKQKKCLKEKFGFKPKLDRVDLNIKNKCDVISSQNSLKFKSNSIFQSQNDEIESTNFELE